MKIVCRTHSNHEMIIFPKIGYVRISDIDNDQRLIAGAFGRNIYHTISIFDYAATSINLFDHDSFGVPIAKNE